MKVYLSSTFRDLRDHRAAVDRSLRRMGHDVIGMEQYAAEGVRPVERCRRDVETADVYVLILGWRYGHVPTADNPEKLSITEIEYRHALDKAKTILAFLLDPELPWSPREMDSASGDAVAAAAIGRFRSEVGSEFLAGIFSSPADLASQVAVAVASQTMSKSQMVLGLSSVNAASMGRFGTGGDLHDTSLREITNMILNAGTDRALVVSLDEGDTWWSTRLFLLASLLRALTPVRQIVFTGRGGRFACMASPSALMEGLAGRFAVVDAVARQLRVGQATEDRRREIGRQIEVWDAFFGSLGARAGRRSMPPLDPVSVPGVVLPVSEEEVQVGVREELLKGWLGERLIDRCIHVQESLSMSQVQQIVDSLVPDVPLEIESASHQPGDVRPAPAPTRAVDKTAAHRRGGQAASTAPPSVDNEDPRRIEIKVIDRDGFALDLAREWVRIALPRNPAP